ncbi:MAG: MerR family transcriptional regulator [Alphaproteobacteria bacterium]
MKTPVPGPAKSFTIGVLARQSAVPIETIRYYERVGLVEAPPRSAGGHRVFDPAALQRLRFIRRSRDIGFSLNDIRAMLRLVDGQGMTCADVKQMTQGHLAGVRSKISDLKKMEKVLDDIVGQCTGEAVPDCPIVDALLS